MNKSVIRHILVTLGWVFGAIPSTKILVPVIDAISNNLDSLWSQGAALVLSVVVIWKSFKFGRQDGTADTIKQN